MYDAGLKVVDHTTRVLYIHTAKVIMKTIGIRASNTSVIYAVYDSDAKKVENAEELLVPKAFNLPDALKYIRNNLLDILREFEIEMAGIRTTEPTAQSVNFERIKIEGVIEEAFASSNLLAYYSGPIATISSKLKIDRADFKRYIAGEISWDVPGWPKTSPNIKEAILTAIGAVNA